MPPVVDLYQTTGSASTGVAIILDSAIKGAVILAMAWAVAVGFRRASASLRHLTWTVAIVSLCVLPPLSAMAPGWRLPILPTAVIDATAPSPPQAATSSDPYRADIDPNHILLGHHGLLATIPAANSTETNKGLAVSHPPTIWILLIWAGGVLIVTTRLLLSLIAVWDRGHRSAPITDDAWTVLLDEVALRYGICTRVSLRVTSEATIPATWGLGRPVVLLPVEAIDWPGERLRAVLLHELAHVARGDFLTQTVARIACALYWFNPLVWLAERRLRMECEQASDDLVLNAGLTPSDYATHLVEILVAARRGHQAPLGALAMARRDGFEGRLRAILDGKRSRCDLSSRRAAIMALAGTSFLLPLGFVRLEARAHDVPKLERLPQGMTIEVVGVSTHPSGPASWWRPDGTPLAQAPCGSPAISVDSPGKKVREVVARITGLPEGADLQWSTTQSKSQRIVAPQKDGTPGRELQMVVAEFAEGLGTCDVHFDIALGPWTTERVFDGGTSTGITKADRAFFFGKAREIRQGTAIAVSHNITDRAVRVVAIGQDGRELHPTYTGQGGAGHFMGLDLEFNLPPSQIHEYQLQSRQVGRFEIKNVALQPPRSGP